jgi:hypothetical protein
VAQKIPSLIRDVSQRRSVITYLRFRTTHRTHFQGSSSPLKTLTAWPLKMVPIRCAETSVINYQLMFRIIPKVRYLCRIYSPYPHNLQRLHFMLSYCIHCIVQPVKRPIHSQLNCAIVLCNVIPAGKTEETAQFWHTGLRTVLSSRLSHTELHSSLRETHGFLSFPADTTMASSQGTKQNR